MFVEEFAIGTIFVVSNSGDVDVGETTFSNDDVSGCTPVANWVVTGMLGPVGANF